MNNPIKSLMAALAVALITCSVFTQQASAVPIVGRVDFGGIANLNGPMASATAFTGFQNVTVSNFGAVSPTGSYSNTAGAAVSMSGFGFDPYTAPAGPAGLPPTVWSFTAAAPTGFLGSAIYSFDLLGISSFIRSATGLVVNGFGTANITGGATTGMFTPTFGSFNISLQPGGAPNFSFSAITEVPEGGSALALLGVALVAVEVLRRKLLTA